MTEDQLKAAQENLSCWNRMCSSQKEPFLEVRAGDLIFLDDKGDWISTITTADNCNPTQRYRIRSDYELKPEKKLVRYDIVSENGYLFVATRCLAKQRILLSSYMDRANFSHCVFDVPNQNEVHAQYKRFWCNDLGQTSVYPHNLTNPIMLTPIAVEVYE